jgi:hypothetical protein
MERRGDIKMPFADTPRITPQSPLSERTA